jgi:hypothetical protein
VQITEYYLYLRYLWSIDNYLNTISILAIDKDQEPLLKSVRVFDNSIPLEIWPLGI